MTVSELKDWIFKGACTVACFLVLDIHRDFKEMVHDVQNLKVQVDRHEYILNKKQYTEIYEKPKNENLPFYYRLLSLEAILPTDKTKGDNSDRKLKKT